MSATWRGVFTYVYDFHTNIGNHYISCKLMLSFYSFNKYSQITASAVRKSLKESQRLAAEKRGITALRYQVWENGKGGEQVCTSLISLANMYSFIHTDYPRPRTRF